MKDEPNEEMFKKNVKTYLCSIAFWLYNPLLSDVKSGKACYIIIIISDFGICVWQGQRGNNRREDYRGSPREVHRPAGTNQRSVSSHKENFVKASLSVAYFALSLDIESLYPGRCLSFRGLDVPA